MRRSSFERAYSKGIQLEKVQQQVLGRGQAINTNFAPSNMSYTPEFVFTGG
jgi:hypothetical protein